jgi:hypothetical protein
VSTGPLTNLALALLQTPDADKLIKNMLRVVVMGGAFRTAGNITPSAEFNSFFDPEALRVVLRFYEECQRGSPDTVAGLFFVSLDTTERVQLLADWIDPDWIKQQRKHASQSGGPVGPDGRLGLWTYDMLQKYFAFHSRAARVSEIYWGKGRLGRARDAVTPLARLEFLTDDFYESWQKEITWKQRVYIGTSKVLPRFCHLHDPLAVWVAARMEREPEAYSKLFKAVRVVATGEADALRLRRFREVTRVCSPE